jgi:hypothetical protein
MGIMHKNTATSGLTNPGAAAETVVYTTPAIQSGVAGSPVGITGTVNLSPGTSATQAIIRVRQGGLAGTLVGGSPVHTVAAGAAQSISFGVTDTSGWTEQAGGGVYVVTVQMTGGAATTTMNVLDIEVIV